jgi:hypothetical protein
MNLRHSLGARAFLLFALGGCDAAAQASGEEGEPRAAAQPVADEPTVDAKRGPEASDVHGARRCGECHVGISETWSASAHAGSAVDPLYVAMRRDAGDATCDSCHAPLAQLLGAESTVAAEGVTCDVCHTTEKVDLSGSRGRIEMAEHRRTKLGPLCDAKGHYFHDVKCSPLFEQADLCAGCHTLERTTADGTGIAVHGEWREWMGGPFGPSGSDTQCQSCHMPARDGEVAEGWNNRTRFSDHGTLGAGDSLVRSALKVALALAPVPGKRDALRISAEIANDGAGHHVPTGLPDRRMRFEVRTVAADGREIDRWEHEYGKRLVDTAGEEAPFYAATRMLSDDRIAPGETRKHVFELTDGDAVRIEVRVVWRPLPHSLAARLGVQPAPDRELVSGSIELPRGSARRRNRVEVIE